MVCLLFFDPHPHLSGGVTAVLLGDMAAQKLRAQSGGGPDAARSGKSQIERAGAPTFDVLVELVARGALRLHRSTAAAVDKMLSANHRAESELRWFEGGAAAGAGGAPPAMRARFDTGKAPSGGEDDGWGSWASAMRAASA